ncbi:hypothetical protein BDY24DRAFT_178282 [Mrakia frigida]|uniref:uncharacterized protein n=1 Tax=Mrakia frigida TaxID=29902 RepID=UPI003FCC02FD
MQSGGSCRNQQRSSTSSSFDPESTSMMSRAMASLFDDPVEAHSPIPSRSDSHANNDGGGGGRDKGKSSSKSSRREESQDVEMDDEGSSSRPKDHKKWAWVKKDDDDGSFTDGPALQSREKCVFCNAGDKRCKGGDRALGRRCEGCEANDLDCSCMSLSLPSIATCRRYQSNETELMV